MSLQSKIERFWYSSPSKVRWFLPINFLFMTLAKIKRMLYSLGILKTEYFEHPVIVVGNITVGGTGKTPFIAQLIALLTKQKIRVGIVSRGYHAGNCDFPHQVSISDSAQFVGDEAYMLVHAVDVPLVIDPNRCRAVKHLIQANQVDIILSDDGLQHYRMGRQVEILLFDALREFGNRLMLPFGPLREPVSRLRGVDLRIANGEDSNNIADFTVALDSVSLVQLSTGSDFELNHFSNKMINAITGIGHPERFFNSLAKVCKIKSESSYPDHHPFSSQDFEKFGEELVVMTEKDASKCFPFAKSTWYYLKVEMRFDTELKSQLLKLITPLV